MSIAVGSLIRCAREIGNVPLNSIHILDSTDNATGGWYILRTLQGKIVDGRCFKPDRFEKVEPDAILGRCIQAKEPTLKLDRVYQIKDWDVDECIVVGFDDFYMKIRFQIIPNPTVKTSVSKNTHVSADAEEAAIWMRWSAPAPGHCKCGMLTSQCQYHR